MQQCHHSQTKLKPLLWLVANQAGGSSYTLPELCCALSCWEHQGCAHPAVPSAQLGSQLKGMAGSCSPHHFLCGFGRISFCQQLAHHQPVCCCSKPQMPEGECLCSPKAHQWHSTVWSLLVATCPQGLLEPSLFMCSILWLDAGQGTPSEARPQPKPCTGYGNTKWAQALQEKHVGVECQFCTALRLQQGPKEEDSESLLLALLFCCLNYK